MRVRYVHSTSEESFFVLLGYTYIRSDSYVQNASCITTIIREVLIGLSEC